MESIADLLFCQNNAIKRQFRFWTAIHQEAIRGRILQLNIS